MLQLTAGFEIIELLAYGPGGDWLLAAEDSELVNPMLYWWDLSTGKELPHENLPVYSQRIAVARETGLLAVGTESGVNLVSVRPAAQKPFGTLRPPPASLALGPRGDRLAFGEWTDAWDGNRTQIEVYGLADALTPMRRLRTSLEVEAMAFSPDSRFLACTGGGGFTLWDLERESVHTDSYRWGQLIAYSPSGARLATESGERVMIRDGATGRTVFTLQPIPNCAVHALAFSADDRILATACSTLVQFWDAADGRLLRSFDWQIGKMHSVAFAPDGLTVAAGSASGRVVVWDMDDD